MDAGLLSAGSAGARWLIDGTQLAKDNATGRSTAYRYLHEGIDALAAAAPGLHGALLAARAAGHAHMTVDGALIRTTGPRFGSDRPECGVDLRWSGEHVAHGGNVQVITAPAGWPIGTFLLHHRHGRTT